MKLSSLEKKFEALVDKKLVALNASSQIQGGATISEIEGKLGVLVSKSPCIF